MNGSNSSVSNNANQAASAKKALRAKFGLQGRAIPAVKAFKKSMPFDHDTIKTESWIFVRPDGRRTHVNTYNGVLGKGVDFEQTTYDLPTDAKAVRKVLKGYQEVSVGSCEIAEEAELDEGVTLPELTTAPATNA